MTRKYYTTYEIESLPPGTIFSIHKPEHTYVGVDSISVWQVIDGGKALLLSHHGGETEDLEWFATDSPSRTSRGPLRDEQKWTIDIISWGASRTQHGKPEKLRIYFNRKLDVTPNKRAAHAVHAALEAFGVHPGVKVVVLDKGPTVIAEMRTVIHDAGHTELEPGTLTAGTNWPEDSEP